MAGFNAHLLIIDPQNDFMGNDDGSPYTVQIGSNTVTAALPVPGAVSDMKRLSTMIGRIGDKLDDIHVTLDSHQVIDVAHPGMWQDKNGRSPPPFTIITPDDIKNEIWLPRVPEYRGTLLAYCQELAAKGNYPLLVWPEHCLIGSWGHNVHPDLLASLQQWARDATATIDWVAKGTDILTEHFGALMAEVPNPAQPSTQLNAKFLKVLQLADMIGVAGEASSHCVLETVKQIANNIGDEHLKKFWIIKDCMSPVVAPGNVPDFPAIATKFFADMEQRGMHITNSTDFLA